MRVIDADALIEFCAERWIPLNIDAVNMQPTIQPEKTQLSQEGATSDMISRTETVEHLRRVLGATVPITDYDEGYVDGVEFGINTVSTLPTIQPVATDTNVGNNSEIPNSSDCISRQQAIDALKHNQDVYSHNFHDDPIDKYTTAIIATDIDTLVNLPAIQREPHWIPVSERLPEPRIDVWVNSDLGQMVGYYDEMVELWYGRDYLELIVNAWMPLPSPYQKGATT